MMISDENWVSFEGIQVVLGTRIGDCFKQGSEMMSKLISIEKKKPGRL